MADYKSKSSSSSSESGHDSSDGSGYTRRCGCQKCGDKYKKWCEATEHFQGEVTCERKKHITYTYRCQRPVNYVESWGFKQDYECKWEPTKAHQPPKHCKACKKESSDCSCKNNNKNNNKNTNKGKAY